MREESNGFKGRSPQTAGPGGLPPYTAGLVDRQRWLRGLLVCLSLSANAWATEESGLGSMVSAGSDWLKLDTSLRGAYWSSDRSLDNYANLGSASLWLRAQPELGKNISAKLEGWVYDQGVFSGVNPQFELREAFLSARYDRCDWFVGRKIVVWGRADQINPTDNISSRDLTLLFPEDDDQRRGNFMVSGNYYLTGQNTVSVNWLPEFRPNIIPIGKTAGVTDLGQYLPTNFAQFAVKYDHSGSGVDWSVSYFDGIDRTPDLALAGASQASVAFIRRYHRIHSFGMDMATNVGKYGLRGEIVYTLTQDTNGDNPEIKNPFLFAVVGGDRSFFQYLNVNMQYIFRYTQSFQNPNSIHNTALHGIDVANNLVSFQTSEFLHGLSLRVNYLWLNETVETGLTGIVFFNGGDFVVRPRITYKATDKLRISVGGDYYSGSLDTVLGRLKDNSTALVELRYGF